MRRSAVLAAALAALLGTAPQSGRRPIGSFKLDVGPGPYVSGSRIAIDATGINGPIALALAGPGELRGDTFVAPPVRRSTSTTLIAATNGALAYATLRIVPPPGSHHSLIAVASYGDGIALHDPNTFALVGFVPIGGAPGDVAFARGGDIIAPQTDGGALAIVRRSPWTLERAPGVESGNEVAYDSRSGATFVSDRDVNGYGALTRITRSGTVSRVRTGETAEGLAIDDARGRVYVGNVNDGTVAEVDADGMRVLRRIRAVERPFGIALDARARYLYVVSNTSPSMPTHGGYVAAIDLARGRVVKRSARMTFPLGIAFDSKMKRLFVTDEADNVVYVLDAATLRQVRAPLRTCATPWRPRVAGRRLYVPCSRDGKVDVFDLSSLSRVRGAPFATGRLPLGVARWDS